MQGRMSISTAVLLTMYSCTVEDWIMRKYFYLMRKSMVSDNRRDKVNPSATKLLLGHQSESIAGRWYASADDEEVLNLVYSRAYKHKKDYE